MAQRLALGFLLVASPLLATAFLSGGLVPVGGVAVLVVLCPVALLVVGIWRRDRGVGGTGRYLIALAVVLVASALGASTSLPGPFFLGLPRGALWMLGGLWIAPLLLLGWAFPRTFSKAVLDREDLENWKN